MFLMQHRGNAWLFILMTMVIGCAGTSTRTIENMYLGKEPIIVDHTCTDLDKIPAEWIERAKREVRITYGHTSHGSQIISGMEQLFQENKLYAFGANSWGNQIVIFDREPPGDLGNPDRVAWAERTREQIESWNDVNVVIWSWCGQASSATKNDINTYLNLMEGLEKDYPEIVFVYMTGHLDGTGENGNLNIRNNQIRDFCRKNNKVLYDFADIESYDPNGQKFLAKFADDKCNYKSEDGLNNWADEWCLAHPGECKQYPCAHSRSLNCDLKAKAFWWMMARLVGWTPNR